MIRALEVWLVCVLVIAALIFGLPHDLFDWSPAVWICALVLTGVLCVLSFSMTRAQFPIGMITPTMKVWRWYGCRCRWVSLDAVMRMVWLGHLILWVGILLAATLVIAAAIHYFTGWWLLLLVAFVVPYGKSAFSVLTVLRTYNHDYRAWFHPFQAKTREGVSTATPDQTWILAYDAIGDALDKKPETYVFEGVANNAEDLFGYWRRLGFPTPQPWAMLNETQASGALKERLRVFRLNFRDGQSEDMRPEAVALHDAQAASLHQRLDRSRARRNARIKE